MTCDDSRADYSARFFFLSLRRAGSTRENRCAGARASRTSTSSPSSRPSTRRRARRAARAARTRTSTRTWCVPSYLPPLVPETHMADLRVFIFIFSTLTAREPQVGAPKHGHGPAPDTPARSPAALAPVRAQLARAPGREARDGPRGVRVRPGRLARRCGEEAVRAWCGWGWGRGGAAAPGGRAAVPRVGRACDRGLGGADSDSSLGQMGAALVSAAVYGHGRGCSTEQYTTYIHTYVGAAHTQVNVTVYI